MSFLRSCLRYALSCGQLPMYNRLGAPHYAHPRIALSPDLHVIDRTGAVLTKPGRGTPRRKSGWDTGPLPLGCLDAAIRQPNAPRSPPLPLFPPLPQLRAVGFNGALSGRDRHAATECTVLALFSALVDPAMVVPIEMKEKLWGASANFSVRLASPAFASHLIGLDQTLNNFKATIAGAIGSAAVAAAVL